MRESSIEYIFNKCIKDQGGLSVKFTSPGMSGVPDRIVLMPGGRIVFAEIKAPGKKLRPLQLHRKEQLEEIGFKVYVIDSKAAIDDFIEREVMSYEVHST